MNKAYNLSRGKKLHYSDPYGGGNIDPDNLGTAYDDYGDPIPNEIANGTIKEPDGSVGFSESIDADQAAGWGKAIIEFVKGIVSSIKEGKAKKKAAQAALDKKVEEESPKFLAAIEAAICKVVYKGCGLRAAMKPTTFAELEKCTGVDKYPKFAEAIRLFNAGAADCLTAFKSLGGNRIIQENTAEGWENGYLSFAERLWPNSKISKGLVLLNLDPFAVFVNCSIPLVYTEYLPKDETHATNTQRNKSNADASKQIQKQIDGIYKTSDTKYLKDITAGLAKFTAFIKSGNLDAAWDEFYKLEKIGEWVTSDKYAHKGRYPKSKAYYDKIKGTIKAEEAKLRTSTKAREDAKQAARIKGIALQARSDWKKGILEMPSRAFVIRRELEGQVKNNFPDWGKPLLPVISDFNDFINSSEWDKNVKPKYWGAFAAKGQTPPPISEIDIKGYVPKSPTGKKDEKPPVVVNYPPNKTDPTKTDPTKTDPTSGGGVNLSGISPMVVLVGVTLLFFFAKMKD